MAGSCLVFNSSFKPLGAVSYEEAICIVVQDKGWVLKEDPDKVYRSQNLSVNAPLAIVLHHHVDPDGFRFKPEHLSNNNLFRRDNYTCQYCGRSIDELTSWEKLTRDHIIPLARGGKDRWQNVVTACSTCNFEKADRLLEETTLKLKKNPKAPITWVIRGKTKLNKEQIRLAEKMLGLVKSHLEGEDI